MANLSTLIFGEVLFDCFPDGHNLLGGAPFNVAWHLQVFNQHPIFISKVGRDDLQQVILRAMQGWGMDSTYVQVDPAHPTGRVDVQLEHGEPSYEILPEQAYDYIEPVLPGEIAQDTFLYHGTLALRSPTSRKSLQFLTERHPGKVFIDVNLRQPWWDKQLVTNLLINADWVKMNLQELRGLQEYAGDVRTSMADFIKRYRLDGIIITCGEDGALALSNTGEFASVMPKDYIQVENTVGAGDAFSAVFLLGLNQGWDLPVAMERAQTFAGAITGQKGATVPDSGFYKPFLDAWDIA